MKFLIQFQMTPEAGLEMEKKPGGVGPMVGRLLERLKPEAAYFSNSSRAGWIVADLDQMQVNEAMVALSAVCGAYPEFHVVMSAAEFGAVAAPAVANGLKIVNG